MDCRDFVMRFAWALPLVLKGCSFVTRRVALFKQCENTKILLAIVLAFVWFANAANLQEPPMMDTSASGRRNRAALQAMLDLGGVVRIDRSGRYRISGTVFIGSNTTLACAPGVVFVKTDEEGKFSHVICNKGARTKTYDENIEIRGLEVAINGMDVCDWSVAYGLRGQLAFFYAKNVKVKDFKCLDLGRGQFGLHFCTFENVIVEDSDIRGWKDGIHFGRGKGFRVSRCTFDTGDDPIALNAHDYATSNPELGWISEGVVEDCHDLRNPEKTVGYFCRILAGSWGEWRPGMSVRQSDSVIRPSGVYRVSMQPDGRTFTSAVVPESKPGKPNADGIVWRKVQDDPVTSCGVSNIVFRNLRLDQPRPLFSFHVDDDQYSRSCYPGTSVPAQTGIRFENVKVGFTEPKEAFLFKTPVAGLEFVDCDFGNCTGVPTGAVGWIDFNKNGVKDVYEDPAQSVERRVSDLLSQMTVEEKTCQLATLYGSGRVLKDVAPTEAWTNEVWKDGIANIDEELNGVGTCYRTNADLIYPFSNHVAAVNAIQRWFVEKTRLGIPVDFSNEGIHGLNHTKATPLPAPIGIGSTWNRALVREAGEIVGEEARLIGYSSVYAPILDVARDPRWGRTLECYGEDPFLVGALGAEMVRGIQSKGIASTLKHFAAYSVPKGGRDGACRTDPHVTPRELHEIFLRPFRHVIRETHPLGVMCSYNDWNGEPVAASRYFLTDLLRGEYGFDGFVVSDSEAVEFIQTKHQVAETYADACRMALEAGMNVRTHFTPPEDFIRPVRERIASGRLPMSVVDRRVAEVLSVKFRLGLFDHPYLGDAENADRLAGMERHLEFVDRMQAEAMVLLKNGGLLPLAADRVKRVLVTGPLADETNFMSSRYGPNGHDCISILRGLRDYLKGRAEVVYEKGCEVVDANWPDSEIVPTPPASAEEAAMRRATDAAADCDVIVAVLGEDEFRTGESRSRTSLDLPGRQQMLLERLQATGKPVVLVLVNGQPLTINWADRHVAAILETWFPHCRGGIAVAKTLFGEVNPSGRLTVTFPKSVGQIEYNFPFKKGAHGKQNASGDPNGSGKTRVMGALYPFGHGLSYTKFEYSNLVVTPKSGSTTTEWTVTCEIRNAGTRRGAEVVQLYIRDRCSSVVTYDSVLRGFERVDLVPGESKCVTFRIRPEDLQMLDREMKWTVEPGVFDIRVGASCEDIRLADEILLERGTAPKLVETRF